MLHQNNNLATGAFVIFHNQESAQNALLNFRQLMKSKGKGSADASSKLNTQLIKTERENTQKGRESKN